MTDLPTMPPRAKAIIRDFAERRGVNVRSLVSRCRVKKVFRTRVEVARALRACGFSTPLIGRWLNHDHTTILFYLGSGAKKPSRPRWRAPKVKHVKWIRLRKPPKPPPPQLRRYAGYDRTENQIGSW